MKLSKEEISLIIQEGEGYRIEFKERLTNLDREMVAFANASGGRIFMGITDDGVIIGIDITNELKSQIQDIANNCDPSVKILLNTFENILIIEVREGTDKPYKCAQGFFNRLGPNAQKMARNDIVEFLKSEGKIRFDELINSHFITEDFSEEKLRFYLQKAQISIVLPLPQIIRNLGIGETDGNQIIYNNTSILFFSKNLSDHYFHTAVTCVLYKGIGKTNILDRKDFNNDIIESINDTMVFLKQHLKLRYEFDGSVERHEIPELPYEALREALVNAVIHRDYFQKGANVMVELFDDRLEITSPGGLPKGLKIEEFGTRSLLRNPNIANFMQRIGAIEKMGTGIQRIQDMIKEANLRPVTYQFSDFVAATFFRGNNLEKTREKILGIIEANPAISGQEMSDLLGLSAKGVEWQLRKLRLSGAIRRIGADKGGHWEVLP